MNIQAFEVSEALAIELSTSRRLICSTARKGKRGTELKQVRGIAALNSIDQIELVALIPLNFGKHHSIHDVHIFFPSRC